MVEGSGEFWTVGAECCGTECGAGETEGCGKLAVGLGVCRTDTV